MSTDHTQETNETSDGRINGIDEHETPPDSYLCALSRDVMVDSVIDTKSGYTYERAVIEKWLGQRAICPMTRKPLSKDDLVPNRALQESIREWQAKRAGPGVADGVVQTGPITEQVVSIPSQAPERPHQKIERRRSAEKTRAHILSKGVLSSQSPSASSLTEAVVLHPLERTSAGTGAWGKDPNYDASGSATDSDHSVDSGVDVDTARKRQAIQKHDLKGLRRAMAAVTGKRHSASSSQNGDRMRKDSPEEAGKSRVALSTEWPARSKDFMSHWLLNMPSAAQVRGSKKENVQEVFGDDQSDTASVGSAASMDSLDSLGSLDSDASVSSLEDSFTTSAPAHLTWPQYLVDRLVMYLCVLGPLYALILFLVCFNFPNNPLAWVAGLKVTSYGTLVEAPWARASAVSLSMPMRPFEIDTPRLDCPRTEWLTSHDYTLIAYRAWSGPDACAIVLLHELGTNSTAYKDLSYELSRQCTVFAIDFRGHGKSVKYKEGDLKNVKDLLNDIAQFVVQKVETRCPKAVDNQAVYLFGHGAAASLVTNLFGSAVTIRPHFHGFVLLTPILSVDTVALEAKPELIGFLRVNWPRLWAVRAINALGLDRFNLQRVASVHMQGHGYQTTFPVSYNMLLAFMPTVFGPKNTTQVMASIPTRFPGLIIEAEQDEGVPCILDSAWLPRHRAANMSVVSIPEATHFSVLSRHAQQVSDAVGSFIRGRPTVLPPSVRREPAPNSL